MIRSRGVLAVGKRVLARRLISVRPWARSIAQMLRPGMLPQEPKEKMEGLGSKGVGISISS